jgi:hypothetical protein
MNLEKFFKMFKILEYISSNPYCQVPNIRDFLGIIHLSKPNTEEKELYHSVAKLDKYSFISKVPIQKVSSGGRQFNLIIQKKGSLILTQLKQFSSAKLADKGQYSEKKTKDIMLASMVKMFMSESVTMLFETVQEIISTLYRINLETSKKLMSKEEIFETITTIEQQKEIINKINEVILKIGNKTAEIAESFF